MCVVMEPEFFMGCGDDQGLREKHLRGGGGGGGGGKKEEEEEDKAEDYDQVVDMVNHGDRQFGGRDDSNQSSFD